jgi:hypothetical protein
MNLSNISWPSAGVLFIIFTGLAQHFNGMDHLTYLGMTQALKYSALCYAHLSI